MDRIDTTRHLAERLDRGLTPEGAQRLAGVVGQLEGGSSRGRTRRNTLQRLNAKGGGGDRGAPHLAKLTSKGSIYCSGRLRPASRGFAKPKDGAQFFFDSPSKTASIFAGRRSGQRPGRRQNGARPFGGRLRRRDIRLLNGHPGLGGG